ncbi:MAG: hypothetical protein PHV16_01210 [Candidatus Nanoarchaeia archaeon]|nr:hypothetical protein [Candidatus Nanoarchaeia archaeon]
MKKRGYFFTLDSFIATSIIVIGIALVLFARSNKPYEMQTAILSHDIIGTTYSVRIYELSDNPYLNELVENGNITRFENTVLQQIGEFCYRGMNETAINFTEKVFIKVVPKTYNFQILIINTTNHALFNYTSDKRISEESELLISYKNLIFGQLGNSTMWGPYLAEVRTWQ